MDANKFNKEDKEKVIEFMNLNAKFAKFRDPDTHEMIKYVKLLGHMQQVILPKIESNILEVVKVVESKEEEKKPKKKAKGKK